MTQMQQYDFKANLSYFPLPCCFPFHHHHGFCSLLIIMHTAVRFIVTWLLVSVKIQWPHKGALQSWQFKRWGHATSGLSMLLTSVETFQTMWEIVFNSRNIRSCRFYLVVKKLNLTLLLLWGLIIFIEAPINTSHRFKEVLNVCWCTAVTGEVTALLRMPNAVKRACNYSYRIYWESCEFWLFQPNEHGYYSRQHHCSHLPHKFWQMRIVAHI